MFTYRGYLQVSVTCMIIVKWNMKLGVSLGFTVSLSCRLSIKKIYKIQRKLNFEKWPLSQACEKNNNISFHFNNFLLIFEMQDLFKA